MKGNMGKRGRSFKNRVDYILKEEHEFICSNMVSDKNDSSNLTDEFKAVCKFRPDIKKPVIHCFLSLPKEEALTSEKWEEIAKDYLNEMGINAEKHQYICVRHTDTENDHIHIVANRVGLDGSVWHGKHEIFKTIAACERLEVKHGLTITQGLKGAKPDVSALTKDEIEKALREGKQPPRMVLQASVAAALSDKPDLSTFLDRLQQAGIEPVFNVASTGNVAGVSFAVQDGEKQIHFKGSDLGKKFSWNTIKKVVRYEQDRDFSVIREVEDRRKNSENSVGRQPDNSVERSAGTIGAGYPLLDRDNQPEHRISSGIDGRSKESDGSVNNSRVFDNQPLKTPTGKSRRNFKQLAPYALRVKETLRKNAVSQSLEDLLSRVRVSTGRHISRDFSGFHDLAKATLDYSKLSASRRYDYSTNEKITALRNRLGLYNPKPVEVESPKAVEVETNDIPLPNKESALKKAIRKKKEEQIKIFTEEKSPRKKIKIK